MPKKIRNLKDSELLIIFETLLKAISKVWQKEKKCLVIDPDEIELTDEGESVKKAKDFVFSTKVEEEISISECLRILGATIYHLMIGESEWNNWSYAIDGYTKPLKAIQDKTNIYPLLEQLLTTKVKDPEDVKKMITKEMRQAVKKGEKMAKVAAETKDDHASILDSNSISEFNNFLRDAMGQSFFGKDWQTYYHMDISEISLPPRFKSLDEFKNLILSPCPFEPNKLIKDTHFLFTAPANAFTLLAWREKHPPSEQPKFWHEENDLGYVKNWYNDHDFAQTKKNRYNFYLAYKNIVPNSTSKRYQDQLNLLPEGYEPPLAVELAMMLFLHHRKTNDYLYQGIYGRCQDQNDNGDRVLSGYFDPGGLNVGRGSDGDCYSDLGLAAFRKLFS